MDNKRYNTDISIQQGEGWGGKQVRVCADLSRDQRCITIGFVAPQGFAYELNRTHSKHPNIVTFSDRLAQHWMAAPWHDAMLGDHRSLLPNARNSGQLVRIDCQHCGNSDLDVLKIKDAVVRAIQSDEKPLQELYEQTFGKTTTKQQRARAVAETLMGDDLVKQAPNITLDHLTAHLLRSEKLGLHDDRHEHAAMRFILDGSHYATGEPIDVPHAQLKLGESVVQFPNTMGIREAISNASVAFAQSEAQLVGAGAGWVR